MSTTYTLHPTTFVILCDNCGEADTRIEVTRYDDNDEVGSSVVVRIRCNNCGCMEIVED